MTTYQTKPQTVEAVQWRGDNESEITAFFGGASFLWSGPMVFVTTALGRASMTKGDWAVRSIEGFAGIYSDPEFQLRFEENS